MDLSFPHLASRLKMQMLEKRELEGFLRITEKEEKDEER